MRREEARERLLSFLDRASLSGVKKLWVIHGKGKGFLRTMVHETLKSYSQVESFSFASPLEGGEGVTVVRLK